MASYPAGRLGLQQEEKEFLEGLAGFRNVLVHAYTDIDASLEREAFKEIMDRMSVLLERIEKTAGSGPCLDDVKEKAWRAAERIRARYLVVFGSLAARGCGEDVDLAVKLGRRPRSLLEVGRIQTLLEEELGAPVDLVVLDLGVPPELAKEIVDWGVLVYGDPREYETDKLALYKRFLEAAARRQRA